MFQIKSTVHELDLGQEKLFFKKASFQLISKLSSSGDEVKALMALIRGTLCNEDGTKREESEEDILELDFDIIQKIQTFVISLNGMDSKKK